MSNNYTVNHTVDVDEVLAYIRANPAAFRAQLRAISLGIDTRAIMPDDPGMYILSRNGYWL